MKLKRLSADKPNFRELDDMITAMKEVLEDNLKLDFAAQQLCLFQDDDGSFRLLDSYKVPIEARIDYCYMPTYIGAAILMKAHVEGKRSFTEQLDKALKASLKGGLCGHGYEQEEGRIDIMKIFIKGGLREFLETKRQICPEFHNTVHNIIHQYNSNLLRKHTIGIWAEDYRSEWQQIVDSLHLNKRLYIAYGSNMNKYQMSLRCPDAEVIGKTYLEDWELTIPFYANIERKKGKKTPALVWEISSSDEVCLDRYEGYPESYDKIDIIVNIDGKIVSAMAYIMTDKYKKSDKMPRPGYIEQILQGYRDAGFDQSEFQPRKNNK